MRKLSWMIAAVLSTLPAWAGAVELGKAQVDSHLTEHLKVVIPLTGLGNAPLDEVKVRLAPQKFYDQAGLSLDNLAGNITFEIKEQGKQPVVIVHSKRIVTDPILSLLLEVTSGDSQIIKEYDLLLNPPMQGMGERATSAPSSLTGSKPAQPRQSEQWQTVQNVPDVSMGGTYQVQRGDTLYDIARRAIGDSKASVRGMMQAIINANPGAFVDGNGNALRSGVTLKVPTAAAANTTSTATAAAPAAQQGGGELPTTKLAAINTPDNAAASAPAAAQPKLELLSAEPKTEQDSPAPTATPADATAVPAAGAPTAAGAASAPATPSASDAGTTATGATQQTDEAIASIDAKSAAMSKQIEMLNEQLKQVQGLVAERNQNIAQLQQKVKQSEEQTQQIRQKLESNAENFWAQWGPYLLGGAGLLIIILLLIAVSRGRRQKEWEETPAMIYAPPPKKSEPSAVVPLVAATTAISQEVAAPIVPPAPQFNPQSVIDEARLLVSYNLGGQAVSTLQEAIHRQPNELALYQELARLHSENHDTYALNQVVAQIEEKFGADHVPHLPAADEISAMHGAVNIFDTSYDTPASEIEHPAAEPESKASNDFLDDIPSTAFSSGRHDQPLSFDVPTPESSVESNVFDFDMDSLASPAAPPAHDDVLSLDLAPNDEIEKSVATIEPDSTDHRTLDVGHHEDADPSTDTRLGLVEAFLSVGDKDSYEMIADEIRSEGNSALINHLQEIERKFGHG